MINYVFPFIVFSFFFFFCRSFCVPRSFMVCAGFYVSYAAFASVFIVLVWFRRLEVAWGEGVGLEIGR
jgi:hypothetical protein